MLPISPQYDLLLLQKWLYDLFALILSVSRLYLDELIRSLIISGFFRCLAVKIRTQGIQFRLGLLIISR